MPPRAVLRVVNPILTRILRSPLHRLVSGQLMLLVVTGRRSGQAYPVVVGRHQIGETLLVSASGPWHRNLHGGAPVRVVLDGQERQGHAELDEDPEQVAEAFATLLARVGRAHAGKVGLRVNVPGTPTAPQIGPAVATRGIVRVQLDPIS